MRKKLLILGLAIVGLVALANAARYAIGEQQLLNTDHLILDEAYTLTDTTIEDDLVAFAEVIALDSSSQITGNVALIGDSIMVDATIGGDLTVLGDHVELGPNADIAGNMTLMSDQATVAGAVGGSLNARGDSLTIGENAQINGDIFACSESLNDGRSTSASIRHCSESDFLSSTETLASLRDPSFVIPLLNVTLGGGAILVLFSALGSLALSGVSILAVVIFPRQISHIEEAVQLNPRGLGGTGAMLILLAVGTTFALAMVLAVVPPLGLVLIPLFLIVAVLFFGMVLTGWITITLITGNLILNRLGRVTLPPLVIAAVGNVSLLLVWNVLALNAYSRLCAGIILLVLGAIGLGATFVTRMGTRPLHRSYLVQG